MYKTLNIPHKAIKNIHKSCRFKKKKKNHKILNGRQINVIKEKPTQIIKARNQSERTQKKNQHTHIL